MYLSTTRTLRFKKLPRFRFSLSLSLSLTLVFFLLLPFFSFFFIFFSFCVIVPCKIRYSRIVDMYIHVSRVRFLSIVVLSFFFFHEKYFFFPITSRQRRTCVTFETNSDRNTLRPKSPVPNETSPEDSHSNSAVGHIIIIIIIITFDLFITGNVLLTRPSFSLTVYSDNRSNNAK